MTYLLSLAPDGPRLRLEAPRHLPLGQPLCLKPPHLAAPVGKCHEEDPILDDATVCLQARCHKLLGLADAPVITECWTSGAREGLLEKSAASEARETALGREMDGFADGTVTMGYIKTMHSKFVSTMGELSANPGDPPTVIHSDDFSNLWHKADQGGLTLVCIRGT